MAMNSLPKTAHLTLDELTTNPELARRLPLDLARRFHAVPLAEDSGRVTVAMADPDDMAAREAIAGILGPALYVVQADPSTIDTLVTEIWGEENSRPLDLAVCDAPRPVTSSVWNFSQALATLLGAHLCCLDEPARRGDQTQGGDGAQHDLVIFGEPDRLLIDRVLCVPTKRRPAVKQNRVPSAILVAQQPRWPLKRTLLILCGEEGDCAAAEWVLRLARPSGSAVTVLAVVPPVTGTMDARMGMNQGLPGLLSSDSQLGRQMQTVARHLVNSEIEGTLRLRQGPPEGQVGREVCEGDYDLIAVAGPLCRWWSRWLETDLLGSLLRWTSRPVLMANPATA